MTYPAPQITEWKTVVVGAELQDQERNPFKVNMKW